ncbi:hypothetical protein HG536_0A08660 [Torulaspora globosa]|uniref:Vacuolar protein sorting-associated protein 27 n=1 Tax=Torulaspora globosa TaxID=48254 RepID=A0A7G3ZC13_9SACH|nr:uncharacterized protein HG536_0A08660 [Torulaspora globosa]QLL31049.1 hypothetical protein HG536_0A08660 [Torulaspora globosa]
MSVTTIGELDLLIQKATSESIPNGELDLPSAMEISDVVRSRRVSPKDCMRCLKKRIMATTSNPNTQLASWKLADICIKNGGIPFIKEVCSREFMDTMENAILKSHNNSELEELVTKLFYELYVAFKNDSQLNYVSRVYEKLQARGVQFPQSGLDPTNSMAMFDSRTPADWVDSDACMICSRRFTLINRRHHCRSCGGIYCQEHSSRRIDLPDLGIYEPVRVCDNCYEDYDLKKSSTSGKKKHHSKRKKKARSDDYDEEEQLRKAIELSLRESKGSIEPIVPVMQGKAEPQVQSKTVEEEEDPDLKAAIEASLKEAEEERRRKETYAAPAQQSQQKPVSALGETPTTPNFDLTTSEEEDIHLFASLVERMKTQSATEILEDNQLAKLYQKVLGTRPKLNNALNDSVRKYNALIDMNTKISDIMTIYDTLLERQLNSINLSDRYSVPQAPSDPYSYYQENSGAYHQREQSSHYQQHIALPATSQTQQSQLPAKQQAGDRLPESHLNQIKEIDLSPSQQTNALHLPSEPPYPVAEDDEAVPGDRLDPISNELDERVTRPETLATSSNSSRKLSNGAPYPMEDDESEHVSQPKNSITNYNFPTVPVRKIVQSEPSPGIQENVPAPSQSEEKLLIEL